MDNPYYNINYQDSSIHNFSDFQNNNNTDLSFQNNNIFNMNNNQFIIIIGLQINFYFFIFYF